MDDTHNSGSDHVAEHGSHDDKRIIHFTVDGEPEQTHERKLTAAAILDLVGLDPTSNYLVEVSPNERSFKGELAKEIEMKEGMIFKTKPFGPMPVSCK